MSFCGTCHGGFSKGSQDQHSANAGPINPHELAELARYESDPRFHQAIQQYQQINSNYRTPFLGGSSNDGRRIYQDGRYAQRVAAGQVRLNGKPYDPTKYMFTHEAVEGTLIRLFGLDYGPNHKSKFGAHVLANAAERLAVEHDGGNWAQHTAAMRPEIHLAEKESGSGTPPDLLVDPYKGTKYDRKVEENERANAALPVQGAVNPGAGNSASGRLPLPAMAGPAGGYTSTDAGSDNRGTQQSGDDWPGKPDKGQGMAKFYLIRHGKTALNASNQSDDKIRGWKDVPLDATGKREAKGLGEQLKDSGINFIAHSNMKRSKDTAEEIAKTTGAKVVSWPPARPWNVGVFTGESSGKVHPELRRMAEEAPDQQIPEGESFTQFKCRVFAGLGELLEKSDGDHLALVTHHRVERLIHAWLAAGQPTDMALDYSTMFKHGEAPANADIIALDPERVRLAAESACAELNKQGFQKYTHKAAGYHEGFGPPTPEHPEGSHCGVCRYFKGKDKCMIVEPPIGADDGCKLFMPKGTKAGDDGQTGGYTEEGDMKVRNGKFGSANWDEREGPGGQVTGATPMADGASLYSRPGSLRGGYDARRHVAEELTNRDKMTPDQLEIFNRLLGGSSVPKPGVSRDAPGSGGSGWTQQDLENYVGGYRRGGYNPELPQNAPGQLQGVLAQPTAPTPPPPPVMGVDPTITQVGGFAKGNYAVGAGGPPKASPLKAPSMPKMKIKAEAISHRNHALAKGGLIHALKAGHIDKATHDKAMASIDSAMSSLMGAKPQGVKPKVGKAPMPKPPSGAPPELAGASKGRLGSLGAGNALPYPPPDFGGYGGMGSIGQAMGGQGAQPQQGMQGPMMPWQK